MVQVYAGKQRATQAPHLFAIAEESFMDMLRDGRNQTIVVSGESGAGKTVSAKYIMRYFATRMSPDNAGARAKRGPEAMSETEEQILATNPIMEAFGNAKTTRNDNSSRFGKYIEIMFDKKTNIIGAKIRTYLLERSRLVFQPLKERNYHIFYQLVAGVSDHQREELHILPVEQFEYLNQGNTPAIDGVDDKAEFMATKASLRTLGVTEHQQNEVFKLLAGLLHLGNVKIGASRTESVLAPSEPSLQRACTILGINGTEFAKWIVKKQLITRGEKITSNLTQTQAVVVRDSVAKYIYSSLFDWLVDIINRSLATEDVLNRVSSFIGVLDIYGFEHFAKNSFEQFCINYANEKLQQEFNQHVFKLEQEEYLPREDRLDLYRLLRQPALHRPHRGQDGHPVAPGRGIAAAHGRRRAVRHQAAPQLRRRQAPVLQEAPASGSRLHRLPLCHRCHVRVRRLHREEPRHGAGRAHEHPAHDQQSLPRPGAARCAGRPREGPGHRLHRRTTGRREEDRSGRESETDARRHLPVLADRADEHHQQHRRPLHPLYQAQRGQGRLEVRGPHGPQPAARLRCPRDGPDQLRRLPHAVDIRRVRAPVLHADSVGAVDLGDPPDGQRDPYQGSRHQHRQGASTSTSWV